MDLILKNRIVEELSKISGIDSKYIRNLDEEMLSELDISLNFFYDDEIKEDIVAAVSRSLRKTELPKLSEKLIKEYDNYLDELRKGSVDNAISNAYQIIVKKEITKLARFGCVDNDCVGNMLPDQYSALLSSENALNEIYHEARYSDFVALKDCFAAAADRIIRIASAEDKRSESISSQQSKELLDLTGKNNSRK